MNNSWDEEDILEDDAFEEEEEDADIGEEEGEEEDDLDESRDVPSYSVYRKKYNLLLERCRAIQQDNELLVSRVKEVKKLWKRGRKERKFLINRLDSHGDNFRNVPITFPIEDDSAKKLKDKKMKKLNSLEEPISSGSGRGRKQKRDKEKIPRDPNLPKRPQNPFFQYCKEKREVVAQEVYQSQGVNLTKKELTKILANQWNSLESNDKLIYNERFEEEKAGYNIKMEVYRKLKDESEHSLNNSQHGLITPLHNLNNSQHSLNNSHGSFVSNYDYDDSFD
eukprot:GFUD01016900.1.p1 GENE.GFUD01016900.1~~GFUD01016900.1.p1  ORF type:complete len:280 (-),score=92.63 GFUD01016900.1:75-914(-)